MYQSRRACIQCSCHCSASAGGTKNSISICSNSSVRKMKLPGVISLRNDLPTWAIPKGGLRRAYWSVVLKSRKMPCAVSGRRKTVEPASLTGPIVVSNIRLNSRASVRSQSGWSPGSFEGARPQRISGLFPVPARSSARWSARKRRLQVRQSMSGSVKPARCPEASQVRGCWMIAESSATTSSRSWIIAFHHSAITLFLRSTP